MTQGETFSLAGISLFSYPDAASASGGFEVPSDLKVKMSTWMSVHKLAAGPGQPSRKIAQTFGVFIDPIAWEALWLGPNADRKSRTFAAAQAARIPVTFQFGTYSFDVIISEYEITSHSRFEIGYSIKLEPMVDKSGLLTNQPDLITAAQQLSLQSDALNNLASAVPPVSDLSSSVADQVTIVSTSVGTANSAISGVQPESAASIASLLKVAGVVSDAIEQVEALQSLVQAATDAPSVTVFLWATQLLGSLQSYKSTLLSLTGGDGANAETISGTDLMSIAATYLGDWTRWTDIAALNGLVDPLLATPMLLKIPPARPGATVS